MKKWIQKKTAAFVAMILTLTCLLPLSAASVSAAEEEVYIPESPMQEYVEAMQPGWNLGNTLDALAEEDGWGNPITTQEMIQFIADSGFKSIRIPVTWNHRLSGPDYTIDPAFIERVQTVVQWALDADLYVMINLHRDSEWLLPMNEENHDELIRKFSCIWTQLAEAFKDYPNKLMFESINEPRFSDDWGENQPEFFVWAEELNNICCDIVRASGGNNATRPIVLPTITCNSDQARLDALAETIRKRNDPNLIATVHYYGQWVFSVNVAGATRFNDEVIADMTSFFDRTYNTLTAQGIPVIVGEFGLLGFDKSVSTVEQGEILKFFEYLTHYVPSLGMPLMWWDNGQHLDRVNLVWKSPEIAEIAEMILHGILEGRSSYTEDDFIFLKKDEEPEDVTMSITLNGNTFKSLLVDGTPLQEGTDYILSETGDSITFTKELLTRLTESKELGVNAVLTCQFSDGLDWDIDVIYYDTPRLGSWEDISSDFGIPAQFNGDRLATMEAVYTDTGQPAGPVNWTPYQEFYLHFRPDYETDTMYLTQQFFDGCEDRDISLRFHFWSGEVVQYEISKLQNWIEGVSYQELDIDYPGKNDPKEPVSSESDDTNSAVTESDAPVSAPSGGSTAAYIWVIVVLVVAIVVIAGIWVYMKKVRGK